MGDVRPPCAPRDNGEPGCGNAALLRARTIPPWQHEHETCQCTVYNGTHTEWGRSSNVPYAHASPATARRGFARCLGACWGWTRGYPPRNHSQPRPWQQTRRREWIGVWLGAAWRHAAGGQTCRHRRSSRRSTQRHTPAATQRVSVECWWPTRPQATRRGRTSVAADRTSRCRSSNAGSTTSMTSSTLRPEARPVATPSTLRPNSSMRGFNRRSRELRPTPAEPPPSMLRMTCGGWMDTASAAVCAHPSKHAGGLSQ